MRIYEIDLHYHAGQERAADKTLRDHVEYARHTGRRILGLTDHINLYMPSDKPRSLHYLRSTEGLIEYRRELEELKSGYPDMRFYFAPELYAGYDYRNMDRRIIETSDYFICEPPHSCESRAENTAGRINCLRDIAELRDFSKRPAFMAHPLRALIYRRAVEDDFGIRPEPKKSYKDLSPAEVNEFLRLDVGAFADESKRLDVPIELNGETQYRAGCLNNPIAMQVLWAAYAIMLERGAELVPSSDQHDFSIGKFGTPVAQDCFDELNIGAEDIRFIKELDEPRAL